MKRNSLAFLLTLILLLSCAVSAAPENTPLFDLYTAPEKRAFIENFDPGQADYAGYHADEHSPIETENPAKIQALYDALGVLRVTGEYTEGIMVTDAGSSVYFVMKDGTQVSFGFDFGHPIINGKLYNITDREDLEQVLWNIENDPQNFQGKRLLEAYSDAAIQDFVQNFDPRKVEGAQYCYGEEAELLITYKEAIRELYNCLFSVTIVQKDRDGAPLEKMQSICFLLDDGEMVTFSFEWESMLRAEIDGTVYICQWDSTLGDFLEALQENGGLPEDRLPFPDSFTVSSVEAISIQLGEAEPVVTRELCSFDILYNFLDEVRVLESLPDIQEECSIRLSFAMEDGSQLYLRFAEEGDTLLLDMDGQGYRCKYGSGSLEEALRFATEFIP